MTDDLVSRLNAELSKEEERQRDRTMSLHEAWCGYQMNEYGDACECEGPAFVLRWVSGVRELVEWHGATHVCGDGLVHSEESRRLTSELDGFEHKFEPCGVLKIVASMLGVNL